MGKNTFQSLVVEVIIDPQRRVRLVRTGDLGMYLVGRDHGRDSLFSEASWYSLANFSAVSTVPGQEILSIAKGRKSILTLAFPG